MERDSSAARRPATSNDVARLAGVSQATVSYVLNDTPGKRITAQTRARVLDAAARLGYVPSASAQSLRSGQSNLVLIPIPDIPVGQAFIAFLNGCARSDTRRSSMAATIPCAVQRRRGPGPGGVPLPCWPTGH
jgi:DNA-binding LacI/PurR family transcriptional regulator